MIIQVDKYKFQQEITNYSLREAQRLIIQQRIGEKPLIQDEGPELWEIAFGLRADARIFKNLEKNCFALLQIKRNGVAVNVIQGNNTLGKAYIRDWDYEVEEMDDKGRPIVISCNITMLEAVTK